MLRPLQDIFQPGDFPDLLVGLREPDDAAVWKLDEKRALVITTDFFTPVVDDPYDYGAIAAANSLSDVYAMGGRPFLALNMAALPPDLPLPIAQEILRGGAEKARQAGVVIAGGHTIQDDEPKYGLIAVGLVETDRMATKSGARPGDRLVITKPLGFGVTTTALKQGHADAVHVAEAVQWMSRLNEKAGQLINRLELRCATDVTGFGLLGHAWEIARISGVGLAIQHDRIPFLSGARGYAETWTFPGGSFDNRKYFGDHISFGANIAEPDRMLLFDAQTSGGLLLCVPPGRLEELKAEAESLEIALWEIGRVIAGSGIEVTKE